MVFKKNDISYWKDKKLSKEHCDKLSKSHKHPRPDRINPEIDKWLAQEQGKHFCQCGCGGLIDIKRRHYSVGIPKAIKNHVTQEQRKRSSDSHKGLQAGEKHPRFGKTHTQETKDHWSKIRKGRKLKESTIEKMLGRIPWNKGIEWDDMKGENHPNYNGGKKAANARQHSRRKQKGFEMITVNNPYDEEIEYHHLHPDLPYVVPCPKRIHQMFGGKNHFQNVNAMLGVYLNV